MKKLYILPLLLSVLFFSCSKDDAIVDPPMQHAEGKGVYVLSEGMYAQNNASLSFYDLTAGSLSDNVYQSANNAPLGDIANHMQIVGGKIYIAVNVSNKVEIVDAKTFKSLGYVDLGQKGSPREIFIKDSTTGYATSSEGSSVIKFNPSSKKVLSTINVGSRPEGIASAGGNLYVANSGFGTGNTVSVINMSGDNVTATIKVGANPVSVLNGPDGNIYVLCVGNYSDTTGRGGIYKINSASNTVEDSVIVKYNPSEACFIDGGRMLVSNSKGAYIVDPAAKSVSATPLLTGRMVNDMYGIIYSLAYDADTKLIYCGNPKDFQQNGEVVYFDLNGTEKGRFKTGINPGNILIK